MTGIDGAGVVISRRTMLAWTGGGALGVLASGVLGGCGDARGEEDGSSPQTTLSEGPQGTVSIVELGSTPGPSFIDGPGAVAQEMAFYRDEGVDVSTEYPGNSVRAIQTISGGTGTIAASESFALLVGTAEGLDLRSIFLLARGYAFGFAVTADSPIEEWSEATVAGARIGITEFSGGEVPVLRGALARLGLSEGGDGGVELVPIGTGGPETADAIESGSVDMFAGSVLDFAIFRNAGIDSRIITPDYIQEFPSQGYLTTPDLLEPNRDAFVRLLRAKAKATVFIHANPMAAAEMAIANAPASAEGIEVEFVASLFQSLYADGNAFAFDEDDPDFQRIGMQNADAFDDFQQFLLETGSEGDDGSTLTAEVDVESVLDNTMIDEINDFDYAEIQALAEDA